VNPFASRKMAEAFSDFWKNFKNPESHDANQLRNKRVGTVAGGTGKDTSDSIRKHLSPRGDGGLMKTKLGHWIGSGPKKETHARKQIAENTLKGGNGQRLALESYPKKKKKQVQWNNRAPQKYLISRRNKEGTLFPNKPKRLWGGWMGERKVRVCLLQKGSCLVR